MHQIPWMRWGAYGVVVVFPISMIVMNLLFGGTLLGAFRNSGWMIVGLPLFWLLGIPLLMRASASRTLRSTPAFQGELVYELSEAGVEMRSAVSSSQLAWSAFTRAVETREFVLLFQNKAMALFFPKSGLTEPGDYDELQRLISRHLGERARMSTKPLPQAT